MTRCLRTLTLCAMLCLPSVALAETSYSPPEIAQGENGWESYIGPMMLDKTTVAGLNPAPNTPEAAVVRFLASRIRGDRAWQQAIVSSPGRKAKKGLKTWKSWRLNAAQIQSRKMRGANRGYVSVWLDLTIAGEKKTGTDDFTVKREGDGWRIAEVPS
ncbi:hypothetical protein N4R57_07185 [Rhodobacteraceae bacterium D3-12]|nr:hypothetical protein N4R57_07185 [Rhodobacteraceae bacterium D3-12]